MAVASHKREPYRSSQLHRLILNAAQKKIYTFFCVAKSLKCCGQRSSEHHHNLVGSALALWQLFDLWVIACVCVASFSDHVCVSVWSVRTWPYISMRVSTSVFWLVRTRSCSCAYQPSCVVIGGAAPEISAEWVASELQPASPPNDWPPQRPWNIQHTHIHNRIAR